MAKIEVRLGDLKPGDPCLIREWFGYDSTEVTVVEESCGPANHMKVKYPDGKVGIVHKARVDPIKKKKKNRPKCPIEADAIVRFYHDMRKSAFVGKFNGEVHCEGKRVLVKIRFYDGKYIGHYWVRADKAEVIDRNGIRNPNECYKFRELEAIDDMQKSAGKVRGKKAVKTRVY